MAISNFDSDDISPTDLDIERLRIMSVGDVLFGESNRWKVLKYKNDYTLIINCKRLDDMKDFKTVDEIIAYLKDT